MLFRVFVLILTLVFVSGCMPSQTPRTALEAEVAHVVNDFYQAVQAKDARRVYNVLDDDLKKSFTYDAFQKYFESHYSQFLTFATGLHDEWNAQPSVISAQLENDPCAEMRLITNDEGYWRLAKVPGYAAADSEEKRKNALIQALRTRQFHAVVDDYALRHPEIERAKIRQLKRVLAFENIPVQNVNFVATEAIIDIGYDRQIRMSCEPQGWRLVSCSL